MKFSEMPYSRADIPAIIEEGRKLIEKAAHAGSGEEQFEIHQAFNKNLDHLRTMGTIANIRRDGDVTDKFYEEEKEYYDQKMPEVEALENEYQKVLFKAPYRAYMEEKIGPVPFKSMELAMKAFDEKLIPLMQEDNAICTRYSKLLASAKIEWEGETLNLSLMQKYLRNADRSVRVKAWEKWAEYFDGIQDELDEIFDLLVKNRTKQAQMLGYENFIEMGYCRMNRNSYTREDVEKFRSQVKNVFVPFAAKMHENRRKRLGVDQLYYYDESVYFPQGDPAPVGTPEEILENGLKMYSEMSEETKDFFTMMRENELFDVFGRKNKAGGGYMTELPDYNVPFVYANFNGTSGDVDVITHECGHAFQGYIGMKDPITDHNRYLTMETAEIHSMSMEFFAEKWTELFFGDRADDYRKMHLEDTIAFIPYGTMVDEFQHIVYENPELTPAERRGEWARLEKEYRPYRSPKGCRYIEEGGFWQRQRHIYEMPFYYIDYVLAQSCAFQYKIMMEKDYKAAWESYMKLCKLSASDFYPNMLAEAGLKVPFADGFMEEIVKELEKKISL